MATARRNNDGTWDILDVPVFASNRLRKVHVTKEWQEKAIRLAQARAEHVGHLLPLHEFHSGSAVPTRHLGFFRPKTLGKLKTVERDEKGELVFRDEDSTIADFVSVPDADYQRIKRGELPYVSVEADLAAGELHGCAMLPHAPAVKFPPVQITHEEPATTCVRYESTTAGVRTTLRFAALNETDEKPDDAKPGQGSATPPSAPDGKPEGKDDGAGDLAARVTALEAKCSVFEAFLRQAPRVETPANPTGPVSSTFEVTGAGGSGGTTSPAPASAPAPATATTTPPAAPAAPPPAPVAAPPPPAAPVVPETPPAPVAPATPPDQFTALSRELGSLRASQDALAAELRSEREDRALRTRVRSELSKLQLERFQVTATEDELVEFAKSKGFAAFEGYVEGTRKHGRKAPPLTIEDAIEAGRDPDVEKFAALGGPALEAAQQFAAVYDGSGSAVKAMPREKFIRNNLIGLGLIDPSATKKE
jgi:hypothetical protein